MNIEHAFQYARALLRLARRALREIDPHLPIVEDITDFLAKAERVES